MEIMKILISAEFFLITVFSFILIDKCANRKDKFLNFMTSLFVVVGVVILSTFVFFTG